jgi:hypothetical protein
LSLTAFDIGKLKIAAHVREELDLAGLASDAIRCKSGDLHTRPGTARLSITVGETNLYIDLTRDEVEGCQSIVAGEVWYKIARLIEDLRESAPGIQKEFKQ